ncbi:IS481 family transposase [Desulfosoma caldarium]|uniref:Integrase-like protein n=2 Tax=Desulfosoma caldarium TaxID=610254 RepID=A0A3N1UJ49_9BACT|nr:IS481 family transposase [Desulfosoma caldarium]ROQ90123.1 integrase-like protein [Desulfosoma caldarium]
MLVRIHKRARTTPAIRKEIQQSTLSERALATQYGITRATVRKWKHRDSCEDRPTMPKTLHTTLSAIQERVVVELRTTLLLPLDDLLAVTREFINPKVSRSGLHRCLRRHGVANLKELIPQEQGPNKAVTKSFKDYEPGFVHVDVKYLPQMPDETARKYLFVAIDRATRWVFFEIKADKSAASASSFLKNLVKKAPFKIVKVLTDNGKEFTDRFCATGSRRPTGNHLFDQLCAQYNIQHRLIKPNHPQTNGMVERFNGRIHEVLSQTRFHTAAQLKEALTHYRRLYNHHIPQKNLGHITPIQALKNWQQKRPQLFVKSVHDFSGPDTKGRRTFMYSPLRTTG